jgi:hypothetical protein
MVAFEDQTTLEDHSISITLNATDIDNESSDLSFDASTENTDIITVSMADNILTLNPVENATGPAEIEVWASDGEAESGHITFTLTVTVVNDIPIANAGENQVVISGMTVTMDGSGSWDIEGSGLVYNWSSNNVGIMLSVEGSLASFTAPDEEGDYEFTLIINDGEFDSDPDSTIVMVMPKTVLDTLPDFTGNPPEAGDNIAIAYSFPEFFEVDTATIYIWHSSSNLFEGVSMDTTGGPFSAIIPGDMVSYNGVAYYIWAMDVQSNTLVTDTVSIQVQIGDDVITSNMDVSLYPWGIQNDVWRKVSVPSDLDDASVSSIFDPVLGSSGDYRWRLYEWDGSDWMVPSALISGQGYWLNQWIADTVSFGLGSGRSTDLMGTAIELLSGWNLVSSPYLFPVRVDMDLSLFAGLYSYGDYGGEGWSLELTNELKPWGAYAIFNRTETVQTMDILPLNQPEESGSLARLTETGWTLRLEVEGEGYADRGTSLGRRTDASEELDIFDIPKPASPGDYISLSISQPEWKQNLRKLAREFRSLDEINGSWALELDVKGSHGVLTVSTGLSGSFPAECEIVIVDCINGDTHDIQGEGSFTVERYSEEYFRRYTVVAGEPGYVNEKIAEILSVIPREFTLSQNYPNPFNPTTTIQYSVAVPGKVQIMVYDLLGREVKTLVNRFHEVGYGSVEWNGTDSRDVPVASGVYFYRLSAPGATKVQKMVLMK